MGQKSLAARGRLGSVTRRQPDDSAAIDAAKRELAEAKLTDYIERVVSEAPPLTGEQRERLGLLLCPSKAGAA